MIYHSEEGNKTPKSTEEKLTIIYSNMVKNYGTEAMLSILIEPQSWTEELVEGVKNKILTISKN